MHALSKLRLRTPVTPAFGQVEQKIGQNIESIKVSGQDFGRFAIITATIAPAQVQHIVEEIGAVRSLITPIFQGNLLESDVFALTPEKPMHEMNGWRYELVPAAQALPFRTEQIEREFAFRAIGDARKVVVEGVLPLAMDVRKVPFVLKVTPLDDMGSKEQYIVG